MSVHSFISFGEFVMSNKIGAIECGCEILFSRAHCRKWIELDLQEGLLKGGFVKKISRWKSENR